MRGKAVSSVLAFLVVTAGVILLTGFVAVSGPAGRSVAVSKGVLAPNGAFDYNSTAGLNLTLSVSGRSVNVGDYIRISASLFNTRYGAAHLNNPAGGGGMTVGLPPCSQFPLGVGILRGNWTNADVSKATPLQVYNPGVFFGCPAMFNIDHYTLAPRSDLVTGFSLQPSGMMSVGSWNATAGLDAWGYWTVPGQSNGSVFGYPGEFRSFEPGVYTAIAEDPWGEVALLTFAVVGNGTLPSCTSMATSSTYLPHSFQPPTGTPLALSAYYTDPTDNDSVFLALDNAGNYSVTVVNLGNAYTQFEGNLFPGETTVESWYGVVSGVVSYPPVVPAHGCLLVHLELPGPAISYLGVAMQFGGGGNETILKGGLPLLG